MPVSVYEVKEGQHYAKDNVGHKGHKHTVIRYVFAVFRYCKFDELKVEPYVEVDIEDKRGGYPLVQFVEFHGSKSDRGIFSPPIVRLDSFAKWADRLAKGVDDTR